MKEEKLKRRVINSLGMGLDEARRVASSGVSIKISAVKALGGLQKNMKTSRN